MRGDSIDQLFFLTPSMTYVRAPNSAARPLLLFIHLSFAVGIERNSLTAEYVL